MNLSMKEIARATESSVENAALYHPHLNAAMSRFEITTPARVAAFLATVSIESAKLSKVEEDLYYKDAERLASIYPRAFKSTLEAAPYVKNPTKLGTLLYNGYHGRGLIQLTWLRNYQAASIALHLDCVANPDLLKQPQHAAMSAAWFWTSNGCNAAADQKDAPEFRRLINGKARMHLMEVAKLWAANLQWMEVAS